jgi:hypothetical protein
LYDVLLNVGYREAFSYSVLYFDDKAFGHAGSICPLHITAYGLLLCLDFVIQSVV